MLGPRSLPGVVRKDQYAFFRLAILEPGLDARDSLPIIHDDAVQVRPEVRLDRTSPGGRDIHEL